MKKKIKLLMKKFETNIFSQLRQTEFLFLDEKIKEIEKDLQRIKKFIPLIVEYPNIETEMEKINILLEQYQLDFEREESKEETSNKLSVLSGKLHSLSIVYNEIKDLENAHPILIFLKNNLESHIQVSAKYQNLLLKMVNSVHRNELQKIKKNESQAEKLLKKVQLINFY